MSIFLLPRALHYIKDEDVVFKVSDSIPNVLISNSLHEMLSSTKIQIEQNEGWDNYKKLTNPFEFIHTVVPGYKSQVSKLTPLSRSFYKMIEIGNLFNLCNNKHNNSTIFLNDYIHNIHNVSNNCNNDYNNNCNEIGWYTHDSYYEMIYNNTNSSNSNGNGYGNHFNNNNNSNSFISKNKNALLESVITVETGDDFENASDNDDDEKGPKFTSFHLAEGPGGFIEAVAYMRNNKNDKYYGMTLISNDSKCPGWKKSKKFLEENPNVIVEKGIDKTGNLLSHDNFMYCYNTYKHSMDLVTGDGGIDFSENFNNQEHTATKLIIAQVMYAISMQSNNGNFVLKVFDTFSNVMIDILYLLSCLYKNVYIMKPQTSRYANSEKYVICKGFNLDGNEYMIKNIIEKCCNNFEILNSNLYIETIFNFNYSRVFLSKIEEINIIIGKKQIENIINTLNLINNKNFDKIEHYKKNHIQKCIKWCEKYNIPYNKHIKSMNIFLSGASTFSTASV